MSKRTNPPKKKRGSFFFTLIKIGFFFAFLGIAALVGFYFAVRQGTFGKLPTRAELRAIQNPVASSIYTSDKASLGRFYFEDRSIVKYKDISSYVITALIATEDARFFDHKGVDAKSYFRVLFKTILMRDRSSGGGSTISQQIIKNLYKRENHGMLTMPVNKVKEAVVATRLEDVYSKEDVLSLYLNTVSFGERAFGIGTASQRFFGKKPKDLALEEAATLIGMLKAPTAYSPRRNPEKSKTRRNVVLSLMAQKGYISEKRSKETQKKPIDMSRYNRKSASDELAPHFRDMVKKELKEWSEKNPKSDGSNWNIFTDGIKIYTTIDSKMQKAAENAVHAHLSGLQSKLLEHWIGRHPWGTSNSMVENAKKASARYKKMKKAGSSERAIDLAFKKPVEMTIFDWDDNGKPGKVKRTMSPMDSIIHYQYFLNTGFMAMEPQTGKVKALVGSIDHRYFKHNYTQVKRQVGSTFKPLVYATALENGTSPCNYYHNVLITWTDHNDWTPRNASGLYGGFRSMRGALTESLNTVSSQVIMEEGVDDVIELAKKMGIKNEVPKFPSIALGTAELTLEEMVGSYCALANGGYQTPARIIERIVLPGGKVIPFIGKYESAKTRPQAVSKETAAMMTEMLQCVVDSGTARRIRWMFNLNNEVAGKTGTTQNQTDGWFIGYIPDLVAGAWVGADNRMVRFRDISLGSGSNMALPIWGRFMQEISKDPQHAAMFKKKFPNPTFSIQDRMACPNAVNDTMLLARNQVDPFTEGEVITGSETGTGSSGSTWDDVFSGGGNNQPSTTPPPPPPPTRTNPTPSPTTPTTTPPPSRTTGGRTRVKAKPIPGSKPPPPPPSTSTTTNSPRPARIPARVPGSSGRGGGTVAGSSPGVSGAQATDPTFAPPPNIVSKSEAQSKPIRAKGKAKKKQKKKDKEGGFFKRVFGKKN